MKTSKCTIFIKRYIVSLKVCTSLLINNTNSFEFLPRSPEARPAACKDVSLCLHFQSLPASLPEPPCLVFLSTNRCFAWVLIVIIFCHISISLLGLPPPSFTIHPCVRAWTEFSCCHSLWHFDFWGLMMLFLKSTPSGMLYFWVLAWTQMSPRMQRESFSKMGHINVSGRLV